MVAASVRVVSGLKAASLKTTPPVPLVVKAILPLAASVIVISPELVPALVFKVKSYAPLEVRTPDAAPSHTVRAVEVTGPKSPITSSIVLPSE